MNYELWDTGTGNGIARERSVIAMAQLIHVLIAHHGDDLADDLDLLVEDDQDEVAQSLSGVAVREWADQANRHETDDQASVAEQRRVVA